MKNGAHLQQLTIEQALSRAKKAVKRGNPAVALQLFNAVLLHQPNHPVAKKGLRKLQKGLPHNHAVQVETAIPAQDQLNALVNLYHSGRMIKTEQACRELLQSHPQSLIAINILAATLQRQGKLQEAVASYEMAIQLKPDFADAYSNRGTALQELGQLDEAVASCEKAIQLKPDYAKAYSNRGAALQELGRLDEAVANYERAIQLKPDFAEAYSNRGTALQELGRLDEAVANYERAIQLKPDSAEAYSNRGAALQKLGQLDEAVTSCEKAIRLKPDYAKAYSNRGIALQELGRLDEAVASCEKAIELTPDFAEAYSNRGTALQELGQLDEAVASCEKAIELMPDFAEAYSNCGAALQKLGQLDEAVASCEKAIRLKPAYAKAYSNRGTALQELGLLDEAVASYEKAIQLKPDYAEAYSNRGTALQELGQLDEAVASCEKAIQLKPDFADAYSNRGTALQELGQLEAAITSYQKAVSIDPQNGLFWSGFSYCLKAVRFTSWRDDSVHYLAQILEQSTVRPGEVSRAVVSALHHHPIVSRVLKQIKSDHIDEDIDHLTEQLSTVPLLLRLMELSSIADLDVEKMLTEMRKIMLHKATNGGGEAQGLPFYAALAMHCFTNEYVLFDSEAEKQELELLQEQVKVTLEKEGVVSPTQLAILGSYRPLHSYSWADDLMKTEWSGVIEKVIEAQIDNVREEQALHSKIPCLSPIKDKVSQVVRSQYEESPYPRWINTGLSDKPRRIWPVLQSIKLHLDFDAQQLSNTPDILVAGCGTGQHALSTASRFLDCNLLAVDLSLSSLSYAKRKTQELGFTNIEYMQADILNLNRLKREFDIIESVGVLHHMNDPLTGWKTLVGRLRTDGFMKIGLYSEIARQHIVEARRKIALKEYTSSPDDIRRYRKKIINMDVDSDSKMLKVLDSPDFYSLSTCRDLLFHVQEHRFTLPQIEDSLSDLGLRFLGFEMESWIRSSFSERYPEKDALQSLPLWHEFELENPNTFMGMYQFWVQKT